MSMWWIGVLGEKIKSFEATEVEAYSKDFEDVYGIAFGIYRSKEQAESDMKTQRAHLIKEAESEVQKRQKGVITVDKLSKTKEDIEKGAETFRKVSETPLKSSKPAILAGDIRWEEPVVAHLKALQELKLTIVRALETGKELKKQLDKEREDDKNNS